MRSAVGQGRLLLAERFPQFRELVARSKEGAGQEAGPAVQLADLQGFWEMIFIQVARVVARVARVGNVKW